MKRDDIYKWDILKNWKTQRSMVIPIDASEFEGWHKEGHPGTPCVIIEYGKHAFVISVVPLANEGYLDIVVMGFTDGLIDPTTESFGMSRDKEWSEHIEFPHFALLVGRPRKKDEK